MIPTPAQADLLRAMLVCGRGRLFAPSGQQYRTARSLYQWGFLARATNGFVMLTPDGRRLARAVSK